MRIVLLLLVACAGAEAEQDAWRERYSAKLSALNRRWNEHYQPYIAAACRDDSESAQCAHAKFEAEHLYAEEQHRLDQEEPPPDRQRSARRPVVCNQIGTTTVCN